MTERSTGDWSLDAACRDTDPELFFPLGVTARYKDQYLAARAICLPCPVRQECLAFALANDVDHGIWAGTTPGERRRLVAPRRPFVRTIRTVPHHQVATLGTIPTAV